MAVCTPLKRLKKGVCYWGLDGNVCQRMKNGRILVDQLRWGIISTEMLKMTLVKRLMNALLS